MVILRKENNSDYADIVRVNDLAFGRKAEGNLVNALRKTDLYIPDLSIVAETDSQVVGHILFYPVFIHDKGKKFATLTLAPMSVLPDFQKKSIGKLLVLYGLQVAHDLNHSSVVVLGHPSYYPKFGFQPASKWNIKSPFPAPNEAFMARELKKGGLQNVSGKVEFPEAFAAL
ncbi:MAG: N-acetyltransferase [bacterium]